MNTGLYANKKSGLYERGVKLDRIVKHNGITIHFEKIKKGMTVEIFEKADEKVGTFYAESDAFFHGKEWSFRCKQTEFIN